MLRACTQERAAQLFGNSLVHVARAVAWQECCVELQSGCCDVECWVESGEYAVCGESLLALAAFGLLALAGSLSGY